MLPTLLRCLRAVSRPLTYGVAPAVVLPRTYHHGATQQFRVSYIDPKCAFGEVIMKSRVYSMEEGTGVALIDKKPLPNDSNYINYANSANTFHGGAQASLHDLAACQALHHIGIQGATQRLKVDYITSLNLEEVQTIRAHAEIKHMDTDQAVVKSTVYCNDIATSHAMVTFKIWPNPIYKAHQPSEATRIISSEESSVKSAEEQSVKSSFELSI